MPRGFEIKPITPESGLPIKGIQALIIEVMLDMGEVAIGKFDAATATWDTDVEWDRKLRKAPSLSLKVQTGNEVFIYVNNGTRPHIIRPKKPGGFLRFRPNYTSKTEPRILDSSDGGSSGGFVYAKSTKHPGTEARDFTGKVAETTRDEYAEKMQGVIDAFVETGKGKSSVRRIFGG